LTEKSIKQEIELSALNEKSTKQEIEISLLKEEIDVLKTSSVMQNAKTSALVEASSTGDPIDKLEERVSENEKKLKYITTRLDQVEYMAMTGIDEVQEELNDQKEGIDHNQMELNDQKEDLDQVQSEVNKYKEGLDQVQSEVSQYKEGLDKVQSEVNQNKEGLDQVQSEVNQYKDSATAVCGYVLSHGNNGIITYQTVHAEVDTHNSLNGETGKFRAFKKGVYQVTVSARIGYTENQNYLYVTLKTTLGKYEGNVEQYILYQRGLFTYGLAVPLSATRYVTLEEGEEMWLQYYESYSTSELGKMKFCVSYYF